MLILPKRFLLALVFGIGAALASVDGSAATGSPHLTPKQVLVLADAAFVRRPDTSRAFKPDAPQFQSDRGVWWVIYKEDGPFVEFDGDMLVVVDDRSGATCVQWAMSVGPCT